MTKEREQVDTNNNNKTITTHSISDTIKNEPLESTKTSKTFIFILFLLYRWWNAYMTRTFDNPDEYWQGNEVAHCLVFGYGYITWEWIHQLRSYFHPLLLASIYKMVALLKLDYHYWIMNHILGYFQATLSAIGDLYAFNLSKKLFGNDIAPYSLFIIISSWFEFLMAPRTLSNTLEAILTIIAMNYWPFPDLQYNDSKTWLNQYRLSLFWASLACITRPTNGLIWFFLGLQLLYHHFRTQPTLKQCWVILWNAFMIVSFLFMVNSMVDTYFYRFYNQPQGPNSDHHQWWFNMILSDPKKIVFVPWTFLKTNVFQSIAVFYGAHPFHWYLSQGLPLMLFTFIPFTCIGFYQSMKKSSASASLCGLIIWIITIYSLLSHKEFRFLYPIFPVLLMMTSFGLKTTNQSFKNKKWNGFIIFGLWTSQFFFSIYFSVYHQRGIIDAMTWLQRQQASSIGFLMPCHSTPWQSMIHQRNTSMWFLTCEPPLTHIEMVNNNNNNNEYLDQADQFYKDPLLFLSTHLKQKLSSSSSSSESNDLVWPTHLVMFDHLLKLENGFIKDYLILQQGYMQCGRFFNSHFHWDNRRKGDVVIMCKKNTI
ncbi:unnamed protein product [Cunninghamella blakesleeana]